MEWLTCIRKTIEFIEGNLTSSIGVKDIADAVDVSPMFLQKGFAVMTGYGLYEYIRSRRLYEAALDLYSGDEKIIDIAFKYAYETPESFTKAFVRFHGATPTQVRNHDAHFKKFLPLTINISISGGEKMEYEIVSKAGLKIIGFERNFNAENGSKEIPLFWDEFYSKYSDCFADEKNIDNCYKQAIVDNRIGDFGICIDCEDDCSIRYIIGGQYKGGDVPEGMTLFEFGEGQWAVFDCVGPMPDAIQTLSDQIFSTWLPGNPDFEIAGNANVEWYDPQFLDNQASNYHSEVWIPVKGK